MTSKVTNGLYRECMFPKDVHRNVLLVSLVELSIARPSLFDGYTKCNVNVNENLLC